MPGWIRRTGLILLFVLANVAIAAPVSAGLDNDFCADEGGGIVPCCTSCIFLCSCTYTE
jgi:hypothetical protein